MDWKPYYRAECEAPGARQAIEGWLAEDAGLARIVARRDVVSFPHTALAYAGPLQARLVHALYDDPTVERVLALGVLHGSGIDVYRVALDSQAPADRRRDGFSTVRGAFLSRESDATPFGPVPAWDVPEVDAVRADRGGLLAAEFSLDTFRGVVRVAADALGRPPLRVLPVYVGMTRDPLSGSFEAAEAVADWVRSVVDASTAVVATGDLVHYGTAYGGAWASACAASNDALERLLRAEAERVLELALREREWDEAYRLSRERIGNDQREMLAVLSSYFRGGASGRLVSFELSDYAGILGAEPPCLVASALAAYERG